MGSPTRFPYGVTNVEKPSVFGQMGQLNPAKFITYFNDFTDYVANDWTITNVGTTPTQALADVNGCPPHPHGREAEGQGTADPVCGSGDDCDLSIQVCDHRVLPDPRAARVSPRRSAIARARSRTGNSGMCTQLSAIAE